METTIKQPIVANENGYYPIDLFYYVEDERGNWAKGVTIQDALGKIKKLTRKTPKKYALTIFAVTNPNVDVEDAIKEVEVHDRAISWKTPSTQLIKLGIQIG
jgi:hypothetical protein